jgi:K+-sensing histidine kinase KdpD
MKLFQKGLLLIGTPIVAQFIFVIVLLIAYRVTEEMAWKDLRNRTQTSQLMTISLDAYRALGLLTAYGLSNDESIANVFDAVVDRLHRKVENLEQMEHEMPNLRSLKAARNSINRALADLESAMKFLKLKDLKHQNNMLLMNELKGDMEKSLEGLQDLIEERSKVDLVDAAQIEKRRWIFLSCVIGGFAANMLMSAGLLAVYARDFGVRFNVLVDNTKKIVQGETLNPPLAGKDELSELDRVFHEMHRDLKEAEDRKNQLMGMVSHDLRSPLTAITLTLEVLRGTFGELSPEDLKKRIENMRRTVRRLINLVNDVLDLDKLKAGKLKLTIAPVDALEVVAECLKEMEPIAQNTGVELKYTGGERLLVADKERLSQVFINLLGNAIKFSPPKGSVEIRAEQISDHVKFSIVYRWPGSLLSYRAVRFLQTDREEIQFPAVRANRFCIWLLPKSFPMLRAMNRQNYLSQFHFYNRSEPYLRYDLHQVR